MLNTKLNELRLLDPVAFKIGKQYLITTKDKLDNTPIYDAAVSQFRKLNSFNTIESKLDCILKTCSEITDGFSRLRNLSM